MFPAHFEEKRDTSVYQMLALCTTSAFFKIVLPVMLCVLLHHVSLGFLVTPPPVSSIAYMASQSHYGSGDAKVLSVPLKPTWGEIPYLASPSF